MWRIIVHSAEKNGLRKTARGSLQNRPLYKVKLTYFEKSFFILHAGTNERDCPPSFHIQPYLYAVTVKCKLRILELCLENYCHYLLWRESRGQKFLTKFWMKERNSWLIEIEMCMTQFCLLEMYQFLKKDCGNIVYKGMAF